MSHLQKVSCRVEGNVQYAPMTTTREEEASGERMQIVQEVFNYPQVGKENV